VIGRCPVCRGGVGGKAEPGERGGGAGETTLAALSLTE